MTDVNRMMKLLIFFVNHHHHSVSWNFIENVCHFQSHFDSFKQDIGLETIEKNPKYDFKLPRMKFILFMNFFENPDHIFAHVFCFIFIENISKTKQSNNMIYIYPIVNVFFCFVVGYIWLFSNIFHFIWFSLLII